MVKWLFICVNPEIIKKVLCISVTVRKWWPLIDVRCCTWLLILCEQLCFGATIVSYFASLLRLWSIYCNRGLICRSFITCSDNKLCDRPVALCHLKNVLHSVVAFCFAVSSFFTVFSHKILIIVITTGGKVLLVPFNVIHFELRYRVTINNVGTKWKWMTHLKTPSLYHQLRILWCPLNRMLCGSQFWSDIL